MPSISTNKLNTKPGTYGSAVITQGVGATTIGGGINAPTSRVEPPVTVSPEPLTPITKTTQAIQPISPAVRTASPDIILFDDDRVPEDVMIDLVFEDIGGQEIISISRTDLVNGQKVAYSPIKNLSSLQQTFNPNNILALQGTSDIYFNSFPIKLSTKIPNVGNGPSGSNLYREESTGNIIIEFVNLILGEQVEVQISAGGTIDEVDLL